MVKLRISWAVQSFKSIKVMKNFRPLTLLLLIMIFVAVLQAQPTFIWGKQFGTKQSEAGQDIITYSSGEFVLAGITSGNLYKTNIGGRDGIITKFDSLGNEIWTNQFGSDKDDQVLELAKDSRGNLYAGGFTKGKINGEGHGDQDIFICKFDEKGNLKATKVIGTDSIDYLSKIYIDQYDNIYLGGNTKGKLGKNSYGEWDFFIMKLDSTFSEIYTLQFGTEKWDYCNSFFIDNNYDIYLGGFTFGNLGKNNLGKNDAFIAKYTEKGDLIKIYQFGTGEADNVSNIIIDKNENIYVSGTSHGSIVSENQGKSDAFIMKFDKNWNTIWKKQFGTDSWDEAWHMDFLNSETEFILSGSSNPDAYIRLYDINGNLKWNQVFAARGRSYGTGGRHFHIFKDRHVYFTGFTYSDLFSHNPNQEEPDSFIVKLGISNE